MLLRAAGGVGTIHDCPCSLGRSPLRHIVLVLCSPGCCGQLHELRWRLGAGRFTAELWKMRFRTNTQAPSCGKGRKCHRQHSQLARVPHRTAGSVSSLYTLPTWRAGGQRGESQIGCYGPMELKGSQRSMSVGVGVHVCASICMCVI